MPLRTRVWGAGKVLFLCGALLLTYVVFAAASMRMALKTREVVVPDLAGKTVNDASAALAESGLTLKVEEGRRVDPKVAAGQVLVQDPQAGLRTRRQRSVRVWISAGPRSTIVPGLVGESERTAQIASDTRGIRHGNDSRNSLGRLHHGDRGRAGSASQEQVGHDFAARESRRARRDLRDAGSHRRQRRPCLRPPACARIPRVRGRRSPLSRSSWRSRPSAEPAGGFSDRARRTDLN